MSVESFYDILGVSDNATQDEIKKAYKKKAIEHHPDKGGNEDVFKKVSEAYDTLGDESKRQNYDNQRRNPFGGDGFNPFGGGFNPFENFFNGGFNQNRNVVPEKIIEINIGALESYLSLSKNINYSRRVECKTCEGKGGERINCNHCNGAGYITTRVGNGMFFQVVRQNCGHCSGLGFNFKTRCGSCNGECTIPSIETISIKLPHGIDEGQMFKLEGKGDFKNGIYGNIILKVKVIPENNFEKNGSDLIYNSFFNIESLQKESFIVPHPDGHIDIKMPIDFDTSKPLRVKGKGYNSNGVGDLYVNLIVKFKKEK